MRRIQINSKDAVAPAWFGQPMERGALVQASATHGQETHAERSFGSGADERLNSANTQGGTRSQAGEHPTWRRGLRMLRDAAIGLAIITAIPVVTMAVKGPVPVPDTRDIAARLEQMAAWRPLAVEINADVSPLQAGQALRVIERDANNPQFPQLGSPPRTAQPWQDNQPLPGRLAGFEPLSPKTPANYSDVVGMATAGFTADELDYLRTVAKAPIWEQLDIVASAQAVDIIGGGFQLPFRADASVWNMPISSFADSKALAYASVLRAAYHVAVNEPERAEHALRSVMSLGFVYVDDGTTTISALIGRIVAGIGRDGLAQLYHITGSDKALLVQTPNAFPKSKLAPLSDGERSASQEQILAHAGNPDLPRSLRFEQVRIQALASCGSVTAMLFGHDKDVADMFDHARAELARYPSEVSYLDLMEATAARSPGNFDVQRPLSQRLLLGAASAASTITRNPNIEGCVRTNMDNGG